MAKVLTTAYSGLSELDAYAICFAGFYNGIEGAPTPVDLIISSIISQRINSKFGVNFTKNQLAELGRDYSEGGTKGVRRSCN